MAPTDAAAEVTPQKKPRAISFAATTTTKPPPHHKSLIIIKDMVTIIKDLGRATNVDIVLKKFKWHQKDAPDFKETVLLGQTAPMVFSLVTKERRAAISSK